MAKKKVRKAVREPKTCSNKECGVTTTDYYTEPKSKNILCARCYERFLRTGDELAPASRNYNDYR